jgi:hypothetical protein
MLVGPDNGPIDIVDLPIDLALTIRWGLRASKNALPDPGPAPPVEATGHRAPGAIALGQVAPRRTRAEEPQDTVQDAAVVHGRPPRLGFLGGEQRL